MYFSIFSSQILINGQENCARKNIKSMPGVNNFYGANFAFAHTTFFLEVITWLELAIQ